MHCTVFKVQGFVNMFFCNAGLAPWAGCGSVLPLLPFTQGGQAVKEEKNEFLLLQRCCVVPLSNLLRTSARAFTKADLPGLVFHTTFYFFGLHPSLLARLSLNASTQLYFTFLTVCYLLPLIACHVPSSLTRLQSRHGSSSVEENGNVCAEMRVQRGVCVYVYMSGISCVLSFVKYRVLAERQLPRSLESFPKSQLS